MLIADDDDHQWSMVNKCHDHLQSKWKLKKQVEEEFCVDLKHFIWLPRAHLVNLMMMMMMIMMMMTVLVRMVELTMMVIVMNLSRHKRHSLWNPFSQPHTK